MVRIEETPISCSGTDTISAKAPTNRRGLRVDQSRRPSDRARIQARSSGVELLRILAMLLILAHHSMFHSGMNLLSAGISPRDLFEATLNISGKLGVAVFVVITGYFQVRARFRAAKPLLLAAQTGFYGLVLFSIAFARGRLGPMTPELAFSGFKSLLSALYSEYWFVTTYLVLYLASPFLNRLIRALSRRELLALIAGGYTVLCLLPTVFFIQMNWYSLGGLFALLYLIGAYLRLYPPLERVSGRTLVLASAAAQLLLVLLIVGLLPAAGLKSEILTRYQLSLWPESSPFTVLIAAGLVLGFSRFPFHSRAVNRIAAATLGVYLLHDNNYVRPVLWSRLPIAAHLADNRIFLYAPLCILGVYLACSILELARQRLIEPLYAPALTRLADRLTARFNTWRRQP